MNQQIIQVAGFSNSGKTTLVEKLVRLLTKEGYRVGTLKHHGHGGQLTSTDYGKDSWKHSQAGSIATCAVSAGDLQLTINREQHWEVDELLSIYCKLPIDVIVIEGFKMAQYPKIVILKEEKDVTLLSKLNNIFCVISWFPLENEKKMQGIYYFQIDEESNYTNFILQKVKGQDNE
ncbi:molybdopterin-guanine dinucleotide biosynthesis protein B [Anaerobacillus alkalidiazotrophicus]|uniref:Molybdopterin-guanine dinucleotide biosynthesis protein B n=1 Tax=Anaerobacillus alkalidiazotrophicus TaxID=472963 RepID=A0A1S2M8E0_9BACI|nr:molybdopterin-guanine dinucleotide biosynthesis protein B [Anaerobacillus alkalidiazotrophicus]OIJ18456.1 molybdopterin-guanine dinucleotide biosynthesis protein B [Anaerobacillus alkalidiazotrophicus]OIJ19935.1 molybdopterin-guanine dinucleotide biosynthesis protein B [Anaerobacillus alkalidiazotrophicus]